MADKKVVDILLVSGAKENEIFSKVCAEFSYSLEHISQPELVLESTLDPMLLVVSEFTDSKDVNPIKNELNSFFNSIMNDEPVKVSLEDGKQAVEIADEIIKIISKTK